MENFMCDGEGIVVGKRVAVRERTDFRNGGFYTGIVIAVIPNEFSSKYNTVYVWSNGNVYSTFQHCVYATCKNLSNLLKEVLTEKERKERKQEQDERRLSGRAQHIYKYQSDWKKLLDTDEAILERFAEEVSEFEELSKDTIKLEEYVQMLSLFIEELTDILRDSGSVLSHFSNDSNKVHLCIEASVEKDVSESIFELFDRVGIKCSVFTAEPLEEK